MSDFVTRLAERTMGTVPVVRPVIAPKFAPGPPDRPTGPFAPIEPPPEEPSLARTQQTEQSSPPPDVRSLAPDHATREDAGDAPPAPSFTAAPSPPTGSATSEPVPEPGPPGFAVVPDKTDRRRVGSLVLPKPPEPPGAAVESQGHGDARPPEPATARGGLGVGLTRSEEPAARPRAVAGRRPQDPPRTFADEVPPPEDHFEALYRAEQAPPRRGAREAIRRPALDRPSSVPFAPEDAHVLRPSPLSAPRPGPTATPPPDSEDGPGGDGVTPTVVVPRTIRQGTGREGGSSSRETRLPEPEPSAPTIRVSIGRIEVRAVTPPPAATPRRERTVRQASSPSLDEYLKQRGGGRR